MIHIIYLIFAIVATIWLLYEYVIDLEFHGLSIYTINTLIIIVVILVVIWSIYYLIPK